MCRQCDAANGLELGCACATRDECQSGLTCDAASGTCAKCPNGCNCERSFAEMGKQVLGGVGAQSECTPLGCDECRSEAGCKWCNRGGIGACAAIDALCPNAYASVDNDLPCPADGGEPATPTTDDACNQYKCTDCMAAIAKGEACQFCAADGDWMCRSSAASCAGASTDSETCFTPVCDKPECENGECAFDTEEFGDQAPLIGRPICRCDAGWKLDENQQCSIKVDTRTEFVGSEKGNGAAIGIGVTIALVVVIGLGVSYFVIRRRKNQPQTV